MQIGGIDTARLDLGLDGYLGYCILFLRIWGWDYRDRVYALGDAANRILNEALRSATLCRRRRGAKLIADGLGQLDYLREKPFDKTDLAILYRPCCFELSG